MFKLFFLGTCAADFSPKLKGECADCFDMDARRASCALLDDHFLIDCGPHCTDSLRIAGIDPASVTNIFFTHLHGDHFNPENVRRIADAKQEPLNIWVREDAVLPDLGNVAVHRMKLYEKYDGADGLSVTSVDANHDQAAFPQWLLFERNGKRFLYATDGGWFINAAYNFLRKSDLSLLVLDATCGDYVGDFRMGEHNSIPMIRLMLPSLRTVGMLGDDTKIVLTHLAPSLHKPHRETVEIAKNDGLIVAYDGMQIEA